MFRLNNHGYSMTFENGFTVSVRWHKCTNYVTGRTLYSDDPDMNWRTMATDSVNAEVAVIHEASGAFMETPFDNSDTVVGYQSPDQVHEIMAWAKDLPMTTVDGVLPEDVHVRIPTHQLADEWERYANIVQHT